MFFNLTQINDDYLRFLYSNISELKIKNDEENSFSDNEVRDLLSQKISLYLDVYERLVSSSNLIKKDISSNVKINPNAKKYIKSNKYLIRDTLIKNLETLGWNNDLEFHGKFLEDKSLSSSQEVDSIPKTYKPRPLGNVQSKIAPIDMPNKGHHPNYMK